MNHIEKQLDRILQLDNGWLDGSGTEFDKNQIEWVKQNYNKFLVGVYNPLIFPGEENTLNFEWMSRDDASRPINDLTLDINLNEKSAYFHILNHVSDIFDDGEIDLSTDQGWNQVSDLLVKYFAQKNRQHFC